MSRKICIFFVQSLAMIYFCFQVFSNQVPYRTISYSYRIGQTIVGRIVKEVCSALWDVLQPIVLHTPTKETWIRVAADFKQK